jgi:hypothetical protein
VNADLTQTLLPQLAGFVGSALGVATVGGLVLGALRAGLRPLTASRG